MKPGSSKVNLNLRNLTSGNLTVKAKSIVAKGATTNVVPPMLTLKNPHEQEKQKDKKKTKFSDVNSETKSKVKFTKEQLKNCLKN